MDVRTGDGLVVVLRAGRSERRLRSIVAWVSALLPAAILVIGSVDAGRLAPSVEDRDVVTLDADDIVSGPLSLADALARVLASRGK